MSEAATIWMSIKAMNWPKAMIPKIKNLVLLGDTDGSIGALEAIVLVMLALVPVGVYIIHII